MEKIKAVFFDMDGTLLDDKSRITQITREGLEYLSDRGILFGIASGRPIEEIKRKLLGAGVYESFSLAVGMNGSHIQNFRTGGLLIECHLADIIEIPAAQGFGKPLFARGIQALADHTHAAEFRCF